jgi:hypothetical protein
LSWLFLEDVFGCIAGKMFNYVAYFDNISGPRHLDQPFSFSHRDIQEILLASYEFQRSRAVVLMHLGSLQSGTTPWGLMLFLRLISIGHIETNLPSYIPVFVDEDESGPARMEMRLYEPDILLIQGLVVALQQSSFWIMTALRKGPANMRRYERDMMRWWIAYDGAAAVIMRWV